MNFNILTLVISFIFAIQTSAQIADSLDIELSIDKSDGHLKGSLLEVPENKNDIVLFISGSGPTDRNGNNSMMTNNSLKMAAEALYHNGISSFRFDKRGIAASQATTFTQENMRFDTLVADAVAWIDVLTKRGYNNIYIIGHSQGSLVGTLAAQQRSTRGLIALAGLALPVDETLKKQAANQPAIIKENMVKYVDSLKNGNFIEDVDPLLMALFHPTIQPYLMSFMQYVPSEELSKIDIPSLVIQGSHDIQIETEDAKSLAKSAKNGDIVILEGMNHILRSAPEDFNANYATYFDASLPLHKDLMPTIIQFIKQE